MNSFVGIWIFLAAIAQMRASSVVNVTVFYESLCSDSIRFFRKQLTPAYNVLGNYMQVELVPFGKAYLTTRPWSISCQHGRNECLGNAIQACALARFPEKEKQMKFVSCVMGEGYPPLAGEPCAKKLNYSYDGIAECSENEEGRQLMKQLSDRTRSFREVLKFVPTILFNDVYSERDQALALSDLQSVICQKLEKPLPAECNGK